MRILSITAGAAGMYCGSCIRDNALARALIAAGHQVTLAPLYTPTLTDEENVSHKKVFFGGISVYLQQHVPLFRKTPWLLDRLWDSKTALKVASRGSVPNDPKMLGELTVSMLRGEDGFQSKELVKLLDWLRHEPPFDVVDISYSLLIGLARPLKRELKCPVYCTLQGEDLFLDGLGEPYRGQALELIRANLDAVDGFIATSHYYADFMTGYLGLPRDRVHVAPVGITVEGYDAPKPPRNDVFTVGYFARLAPEKGLHLLCEAYRLLRARPGCPPSRLEAAGYLAPGQQNYVRGIERQMAAWGLGAEFHYRGSPDRAGKIAFLRSLDVLSVPSTFSEPKGIFLLEAMAAGVPAIQPRRGVFPEIIERTSGGILIEPDNPEALADELFALATDRALAERLGRNGAAGVRRHYTSAQMAAHALEVYSGAVRSGGAATMETPEAPVR